MISAFALTPLILIQGAAAEYRRVILSDGRVIDARIGAMDASGTVLLDIPQGRMTLHFSQVASMAPITEEEYREQSPWRVLVQPIDGPNTERTTRLRSRLADEALAELPATVRVQQDALSTALLPTEITMMEACGSDPACLEPYLSRLPVDVVLLGEIVTDAGREELSLTSYFQGAERARRTVSVTLGSELPSARALVPTLAAALHLDAPVEAPRPPVVAVAPRPTPPPPVTAPLPPPPEPTAQMIDRLAWAPVPGLPSLVQRDFQDTAIAWAVIVPSTALMVGAVGQGAPKPAQFALLSVASYYTITVAVNRAVAAR